jgi:hypothetical protein
MHGVYGGLEPRQRVLLTLWLGLEEIMGRMHKWRRNWVILELMIGRVILFIHALAKLRKANTSFVTSVSQSVSQSVCLHATTRFQPDEFL